MIRAVYAGEKLTFSDRCPPSICVKIYVFLLTKLSKPSLYANEDSKSMKFDLRFQSLPPFAHSPLPWLTHASSRLNWRVVVKITLGRFFSLFNVILEPLWFEKSPLVTTWVSMAWLCNGIFWTCISPSNKPIWRLQNQRIVKMHMKSEWKKTV